MENKTEAFTAKLVSLNDLAKELGVGHLKAIGLVGDQRTQKSPYSNINVCVGDFSLNEQEEVIGTYCETFDFPYEAEVFIRNMANKPVAQLN